MTNTEAQYRRLWLNDNELFELCKEVYRRTQWDDTQNGYYFVDGEEPLLYDKDVFAVKDFDQWWNQMAYLCPAYTSDYILEKLGRPHTSFQFEYFEDFVAVAWYNEDDVFTRRDADTPIKALLKLTIALHDAGELK